MKFRKKKPETIDIKKPEELFLFINQLGDNLDFFGKEWPEVYNIAMARLELSNQIRKVDGAQENYEIYTKLSSQESNIRFTVYQYIIMQGKEKIKKQDREMRQPKTEEKVTRSPTRFSPSSLLRLPTFKRSPKSPQSNTRKTSLSPADISSPRISLHSKLSLPRTSPESLHSPHYPSTGTHLSPESANSRVSISHKKSKSVSIKEIQEELLLEDDFEDPILEIKLNNNLVLSRALTVKPTGEIISRKISMNRRNSQ